MSSDYNEKMFDSKEDFKANPDKALAVIVTTLLNPVREIWGTGVLVEEDSLLEELSYQLNTNKETAKWLLEYFNEEWVYMGEHPNVDCIKPLRYIKFSAKSEETGKTYIIYQILTVLGWEPPTTCMVTSDKINDYVEWIDEQ